MLDEGYKHPIDEAISKNATLYIHYSNRDLLIEFLRLSISRTSGLDSPPDLIPVGRECWLWTRDLDFEFSERERANEPLGTPFADAEFNYVKAFSRPVGIVSINWRPVSAVTAVPTVTASVSADPTTLVRVEAKLDVITKGLAEITKALEAIRAEIH